jgi:hypothetical protein
MNLMEWFGKSKKKIIGETPAGAKSPADAISHASNNVEWKAAALLAENLAEFVCFAHKEGISIEDISKETGRPVVEIKGIIEEAKGIDKYNFLAEQVESRL